MHETVPRFQSASTWYMVVELVAGLCRLSLAFHAASNGSPNAVPASRCMLVTFAGLRQPVITRQHSCRAGFSLFARLLLAQTGQAYSAAE